jgi:hypothetical protein
MCSPEEDSNADVRDQHRTPVSNTLPAILFCDSTSHPLVPSTFSLSDELELASLSLDSGHVFVHWNVNHDPILARFESQISLRY